MDTTSQINNSGPLVSILMLTYNRAHFIREAISSVIAQTHQNWELIIIDDGSSDNTEEVVNSFSEPRINYIKHRQNVGLFARREESATYPKGKYVAILDSDDLWLDNEKLTKQVDFLEKNQSHVVVGTMAKLIDENGKDIGQCTFATNDNQIREKILVRNQFTHSSLLIRTEKLRQTNGYQPTLAEDLELILQLGKLGYFANLTVLATAHRVHAGSQNDRGIKMALAVAKIISKHQENYPHARQAKIFSSIRLLRARLQLIFKKN